MFWRSERMDVLHIPMYARHLWSHSKNGVLSGFHTSGLPTLLGLAKNWRGLFCFGVRVPKRRSKKCVSVAGSRNVDEKSVLALISTPRLRYLAERHGKPKPNTPSQSPNTTKRLFLQMSLLLGSVAAVPLLRCVVQPLSLVTLSALSLLTEFLVIVLIEILIELIILIIWMIWLLDHVMNVNHDFHPELNQGPADLQSTALTTEPYNHVHNVNQRFAHRRIDCHTNESPDPWYMSKQGEK